MSSFSFLLFCLSHKKWFIIPFLVGAICFAIAWFLPPVYETEMRIQIQKPSDYSLSNISSAVGVKGGSTKGMNSSLANMLFSASGSVSSKDLYIEILSGRDVMLEAIQEFRLDTLYKKKPKELLLKKFKKDLYVGEESNGIISCSFETKNRVMAVELLRFMVETANARYLQLQKENLHYSISYLVKNRQDLIDSVKKISNELSKFYQKNNLVDLESQMRLTVSALAAYESQMNNYEMTEQSEGQNSSAVEMEKRKKILEKKFKELRGNFSKGYTPSKKSIYINSDWAVAKKVYLDKRQSELEMYMTLLESVSAEVMMAEAEMIKNQPVVQIVQDAYIPDWKTKPKRGLWAVAGFGVSFVIVLVYLLLMGLYSGQVPNSFDLKDRLHQIKTALFK